MLMVCKATGCAVDVAEPAVERFLAAGFVPITSPEKAEPEKAQEKPRRTSRSKPKE